MLFRSLIAILGVLITSRHNTERLIRQLEHDAKQKTLDRISALRKEVYFDVVRQLGKCDQNLSDLPDTRTTGTTTKIDHESVYRACDQMIAVADPPTALLAHEFSVAYRFAVEQAMLTLQEFAEVSLKHSTANGEFERLVLRKDSLLAEWEEIKQSKESDLRELEDFQNQLSELRTKSDEVQKRRMDSLETMYRLHMKYLLDLYASEAYKNVGIINARLLVRIRGDLGIAEDTGDIEKRLLEQRQLQQARAIDLVNSRSGEKVRANGG